MSRLWKWSMGLGTAVMVLCLAVMYWYAGNQGLVDAKQHGQADSGSLDELTQTFLARKNQYDFIVILNPAHGESDLSNAVNNIQEKEITLAVGNMLEEMAADSDIGIFVISNQAADISYESSFHRKGWPFGLAYDAGSRRMEVSYESCKELISAVKPDMVIELHVNADPDNEKTFGTSVVYNGIFYAKPLTNAQLADIMERELVTAISGKANGIFPDEENKYPLLRMVQVPMVSMEMGYLTNEEEGALLNRSDYQKRLAQGLYSGILKVREEMKDS